MLITPQGYKSTLSIRETQAAIKQIKDYFERSLAAKLNLTRVSAPFFVLPETGLNDNLSGVERPVMFTVKDIGKKVEVVHSLAKWKRFALKLYNFGENEGIYTDMNAIRRDEELDNLHSIYVDQWDWEYTIPNSARNLSTLYDAVKKIFDCFTATQRHITGQFPALQSYLPDSITFVSSQELLDMYPTLTPKEREDAVCKKYGAVFITQIGGNLSNGEPHDFRAPDYDDWSLNGDMLFYYPLLDKAFEVMSMGIRVDAQTLLTQLEASAATDRLNLPFHKSLIQNSLPQSIGGGLGQSRICMFLLNKAHIGEVHASVWPPDMVSVCSQNFINLL